MATLSTYEQSLLRSRINRYFSESFKRQKVSEIENNLSTVSEISRTYQVSTTAVYKWLYKYSNHRKQGVKQVIEMDSDTKKILALKQKIKELEQTIGQKQVQLDFHQKLVELASEEAGYDIKKKFGSKPLSGSGKTDQQ